MRANEFFYSCIIPFFNSVLEFYLVIVTVKIITAQNMTVKQETLVYQPYYDLKFFEFLHETFGDCGTVLYSKSRVFVKERQARQLR